MREVGSPAKHSLNKIILNSLKLLCSRPGMKILDVGCGDGNYENIIKSLGAEASYHGIDVIQSLKWADNPSLFEVYNAEELIDLNRKFNLIISIHSLEHIEKDRKAVQGMTSCLEDDGIILMAVPSKFSFPLYLFHGYRRYSVSNIKELAERSNLSLDNVIAAGGLVNSALHVISWTIPSLIGINVSLFLKRHDILVAIFCKLRQLSMIIDNRLRVFPSNYVAIFSKSSKGRETE